MTLWASIFMIIGYNFLCQNSEMKLKLKMKINFNMKILHICDHKNRILYDTVVFKKFRHTSHENVGCIQHNTAIVIACRHESISIIT